MNIRPLALLIICSMSSALLPVYAEATAEVEKPSVYQVELLIFRHTDQSTTTREIFRMPEPEMADVLADDLARLTNDNDNNLDAISSEPEVSEEFVPYWRVLPTEDLLMNNVAARIEKLDAYELLEHAGWLQNVEDVTEAEDLDLATLGITATANGHIKLFKRRYLHLAVDIALGANADNKAVTETGESIDMFEIFTAAKATPAISDSRRVRLEELMYFDQPEFGVLAIVAKSEQEISSEPVKKITQATD